MAYRASSRGMDKLFTHLSQVFGSYRLNGNKFREDIVEIVKSLNAENYRLREQNAPEGIIAQRLSALYCRELEYIGIKCESQEQVRQDIKKRFL